jgi:hypothetical protein
MNNHRIQMCDEPQTTFDKGISIELPDSEEAAKLRALTPDARIDIVRKGFAYDERERRCVFESLNSEYAAQRAILETEKIQLSRSHEIRIEQMQKTSQERIGSLQRTHDDIKQAHEAHVAKLKLTMQQNEQMQVALLQDQIHGLKSQIADERGRSTAIAELAIRESKEKYEERIEWMQKDYEKKAQELEAAKRELEAHHEKFGLGAACTSGNVAKGHEGERQVLDLLEEYMPHAKRSYDHHADVNEFGKNAVGHSADIGLRCNGIDVLIEVKNSNYAIRKKEIEKAVRDLQEQPRARVLVMISWMSRFQKDTLSESDFTCVAQPNHKMIIFMPNFKAMCERLGRAVLATMIATVTTTIRAKDMQNGKHADLQCAMQQCLNIQEAFVSQIRAAKSIRREADAITSTAEQGISNYIESLRVALNREPDPEPLEEEENKVKDDKIYGENPCQNGQYSENHVDEACTSSENHEVYSDEQSNEDEECDYQIEGASSSPANTNACLPGQGEQKADLSGYKASAAHEKPAQSCKAVRTKRNVKEMERAVTVIKEEMKKEGLTKISVDWMVKILDLHDDTGFERLQRKWDISSVRNSLTRRLKRIGFSQHADKTWSISENEHQV